MTVQMPPAKGQTVAELRYAQPGDGEMNAARMAELLTALAPLQKRLETIPSMAACAPLRTFRSS